MVSVRSASHVKYWMDVLLFLFFLYIYEINWVAFWRTCTPPSGDNAMRAPAPSPACRVSLYSAAVPNVSTNSYIYIMCAPCVRYYDSRCMSMAIIFARRLPIVLHAFTFLHVSLMLRFGLFIWGIFQEYSVQLTFREQWTDERLKFNDFGGRLKYLTLTEANRVWMPDLFFSNEKEGHFHNIIMPNVYIRIFPYGSVLYSIRYLIVMKMHFIH